MKWHTSYHHGSGQGSALSTTISNGRSLRLEIPIDLTLEEAGEVAAFLQDFATRQRETSTKSTPKRGEL